VDGSDRAGCLVTDLSNPLSVVLVVLGPWLVLVGWSVWRRRPRRGRLGDFCSDSGLDPHGEQIWPHRPRFMSRRSASAPPAGVLTWCSKPVRFTGRLLRRSLGLKSDVHGDMAAGMAAFAGVASATISIALVIPAAVVVWWIPDLLRRRVRRRRATGVLDELPEAVDLLRLALGSGTSLRVALDAVAPRCGPVIGRGITKVCRRLERGASMSASLSELEGLGDAFGPVLDALRISDERGVPISPLLDRISEDARTARRRRAEEAARRVPIKLLFPLVFCTLPAFGLLTVVPLLAGAMGRLSL